MRRQNSLRALVRGALYAALSIYFFTAGPTSSAATIADWDFSGLDYGTSNDDPAPDPVLPASSANVAAGLATTALTPSTGLLTSFGNRLSSGLVNVTPPGEANLKGWDVGGDGTNDEYLEFTLTSDVAGGLSIDSISISQWRNGGGAPDGIAFDVSIDGGAFTLYGAIAVDADFANGPSFDDFVFTELITGATSVAIRYAPRHVNAGATGNHHINGLSVEGAVVPEPSTFAMLILGLLGCRVLPRSRNRTRR